MEQIKIRKTALWIIIGALIFLTSCQNSSNKSLKVAATAVPHSELLEIIQPDLKMQGIDLEIIVVEDFNTPNRALNDKEVDANFFQHNPFLESQIQDFGYHIVKLVAVHVEPMALYSKKIKHLDQIQFRAKVAIPSDPTNQARALCLLEQKGLIELQRHDCKASLFDIKANPLQLELLEIDSPLLSRTLEDVDMAVITTNFALQANLSPQTDALAIEDVHSLFANFIAIRTGEDNRPDLQALKKAITNPKVSQFIEKNYKGAIIPAF